MYKSRLYQIDLLRFIAAFSVMLYHYTFRGYYGSENFTTINFPFLENFTKYGYLGVDLFFIISGFVITLSISNSNAIEFIKSRIIRLYPSYWICVILTTIITLFFINYNLITTKQFLWNMTMLNGYINIPYIDGAYWSLFVEIKFYVIIFLILSNKFTKKQIDTFIVIWLAITFFETFPLFKMPNIYVANLIKNQLILDYSAYFIAGFYFYKIHINDKKWFSFTMIIICYSISIYNAIERTIRLEKNYNIDFSSFNIALIITLFYLIFFLIASKKVEQLNLRKWERWGLLTYPLYLIHQNIGYYLLNILKPLNKYISLIIVCFLMIFISFLIHKFFEVKIARNLKKVLTKN